LQRSRDFNTKDISTDNLVILIQKYGIFGILNNLTYIQAVIVVFKSNEFVLLVLRLVRGPGLLWTLTLIEGLRVLFIYLSIKRKYLIRDIREPYKQLNIAFNEFQGSAYWSTL